MPVSVLATSSHDEYLEAKLRGILEALVESLLREKPEAVEGFCAQWLAKWHKEHDGYGEELARLRAERDLLVKSMGAGSGAPAPPKAPEHKPDEGAAAAEHEREADDAPVKAARKDLYLSRGSDGPEEEEEEARDHHEEDAVESAKIKHMQDKDRRAGVSAPAIDQDRMKDWKRPHFEKAQEVRLRIMGVIKENEKLQVLFGHLTENAKFEVIDAMAPVHVEAGANLITQGEEGDNFYIVDEGSFDVYVKRADNPPQKVLEYGAGAMFGELALMYNAPRAATVKATSDSRVWALDRDTFQLMIATAENTKKSQYEDFLQRIDIFQHLTKYEITKFSDLLQSELFDAGEDIMKQGEEGTSFFILEDGEAKAYISGENGEIEMKHYHTPGDFFGEIALITKSVRRATVRAVGEGCTVLSVSKEDFDSVLGPIQAFLHKHMDRYPAYADLLRHAAEE